MNITFDINGDIIAPEHQPVAETLAILQGARPWTRADYIERMRGLVATGVPNADKHLAAITAVIGESGQGINFERGIRPKPDFTNKEIAGLTEMSTYFPD